MCGNGPTPLNDRQSTIEPIFSPTRRDGYNPGMSKRVLTVEWALLAAFAMLFIAVVLGFVGFVTISESADHGGYYEDSAKLYGPTTDEPGENRKLPTARNPAWHSGRPWCWSCFTC
jgi:hypothetical protein